MGECSVSAAGDGMQEGRWWWWWESLRAPVGPAQPSVTSQQVRGAVSLDTGTGAARPGRDQGETSPAMQTAASQPLLHTSGQRRTSILFIQHNALLFR